MNNEQNIEEPGRGIRCVNDKGEVGYNDPDNAYNKHWQRSTGFRPKPLPEKLDLPPIYTPEAEVEVFQDPIPTEQSPKRGRKPKTT